MSGAPRVAAIVLVAFAIGAILGWRPGPLGELFGEPRRSATDEAAQVITENYFREVDPDSLRGRSPRQMVALLRTRYSDRFSRYFDAEAYRHVQDSLGGTFSGVGLSVVKVRRGLRAATVYDGSPAQAAGVMVGDVITAVDGRRIAELSAEVAVDAITGEPGTDVRLEVLRPSTGESRSLTLGRAEVDLPVVDGRIVRAGGSKIAYVRLLSFIDGGHGQLRREIERLRMRGARALVLDLRGNGGGLLTESVLTASIFVEDGLIVSTSGRAQENRTFDAAGDALAPQPIVVLINRDTASAAEILTAALRDAELATLVGSRTFGKGVFQEVIGLGSGGALSLTVGEYLARNGESLARTGIAPDVRVNDDPRTMPDEALRRARAVIGSILRPS